MGINKNQHFVPKVYLRPFGNASQKAINLYNFGLDFCVEGASIKNQCSRNYFYGNDPKFEDFIQYFEGRYGELITRLRRGLIGKNDISALFNFFVLQHLRTPHMLSQRLDVFDAFRNTVIGGRPLHETRADAQIPFDMQREMQEQIYIAAKASNLLHDLRPVLLINRTNIPFITSDNPACVTNRLYTQRFRDETSGLIQSGAAIVLPISPDMAFLAYDEDVFHSVGSQIYLEVQNERDIDRLNELQAQVATESLYFSDRKHKLYVEQLARRCVDMRRESWAFIWTGIKIGEDDVYEQYRTAIQDDAESTETRITSVSMYNPAPSSWPTFLKFKMRPKGHTTGSAIGYVRAKHAKDQWGRNFRQEILPRSIPSGHRPQNRDIMWLRKDKKSEN
ncbi:DUF4238 domain-containing protein [Novosphingobium sp.]|uniref:DUF4238 domain-containing protein n=1 Tax=Novosphingobium sp. TaxID=1874826 RepID=UPI00286BA76A|nr:DUF4238 domain-containing protein [Novosphingobium sp.]